MKKRNRDRFYFFWSSSILICMLMVMFSLVFVSCKAPAADVTSPPPESGSPEVTDPSQTLPDDPTQTPPEDTGTPEPTAPPPTVLEETEDMGDEYLKSIIFLGDSTTYGLQAYGFVDESQIWTPANRTLTLGRHNIDKIVYPDTGEELFLKEAVAAKKPELMVITLGVNGVSFLKEEGFKSEYTNLLATIKEASPDTKIIINTIYPVANSYKLLKDINNEKIDAANTWLLTVAEEAGVRYMQSNTVLKDENGVLPETAHNGDGLHLNADSFSKVVNYIRTHGYR